MPIVKISHGEVSIKDKLTLRDRIAIERMSVSKIPAIPGFQPTADMALAGQEAVMLYLIEKITINGEDKPVSLDTLYNDEWMTFADLTAIRQEMNRADQMAMASHAEIKKE